MVSGSSYLHSYPNQTTGSGNEGFGLMFIAPLDLDDRTKEPWTLIFIKNPRISDNEFAVPVRCHRMSLRNGPPVALPKGPK